MEDAVIPAGVGPSLTPPTFPRARCGRALLGPARKTTPSTYREACLSMSRFVRRCTPRSNGAVQGRPPDLAPPGATTVEPGRAGDPTGVAVNDRQRAAGG